MASAQMRPSGSVALKAVTSKSSDSSKDSLHKLTHLYLHDKFLTKINNLMPYKNLKVLYLHHNSLTKIENLEPVKNITHLYLQKNKITTLENLSCLKHLRKLYLGYNAISVVEGLENLSELQELHIENQQLPSGEMMYFDPRSIKALGSSLRVLDVSGNGLLYLRDLVPLQLLATLNAQNNQIYELEDLLDSISQLPMLRSLQLKGNPVCRQHKYRESLIAHAYQLEYLDGKDVGERTREFLKRFELMKAVRSQYQPEPEFKLPPEIEDLTKQFTMGIRKSISKSILKEIRSQPSGQESIQGMATFYPYWKYQGETSCSHSARMSPNPRHFLKRFHLMKISEGHKYQQKHS